MSSRAFPLLGAAALGFAAALLFVRGPQPASAQFNGAPLPRPLGSINVGSTASAPPQPLEVQSLDPQHFVVATREPRLLQPLTGPDNAAQNMLVTVVTHYTVRPDRLIPVEHVRVPPGYRLITIQE